MKIHPCLASIAALLAMTLAAPAGFHVMQIEQVIGSLNGNTNAQAIQLRLRSGGQNQVQFSSLWAADANGQNRILLLNIASAVSNSASGAHILLTTSAFNTIMNMGGTSFMPDFTLTNAMPASYLSAGRLTFEDDGGTVASSGTVYWSVAWGGVNYTGPNTGDITNDSNGNFGPAFGSGLPFGLGQGIRFTGAATAASTTNLADYALTANQATVTRNNGTSFTVVPEPGSIMAFGGLALCALIFYRRRIEAA